MEDGLGNWQWLLHLEETRDALILTSEKYSPEWILTDGFQRSVRYTIDSDWAELPMASVDCVAVPDSEVLFRSRLGAGPAVLRLKQLLRKGGCYVGIEVVHPRDNRRSVSSFLRAEVRRQSRLLHRAGFSDVRSYYIVQNPAAPHHFVPDHTSALVAWDAAMVGNRRSALRRLLHRTGLAGLVLRYRLCVGRA